MKPYIHAQSSAKKYGGKPEDYLAIHDWFDQTKSHFGDNRHRAILHSSFGIFLLEQVFGHNITNSDGREVSVRDLGEQHVVEDMKFIPTISDYLSEMEYKDWMHGKGVPASNQRIQNRVRAATKKTFIPFEKKEEEKPKKSPSSMVIDGSRLWMQESQKPKAAPKEVVYDGSNLRDIKKSDVPIKVVPLDDLDWDDGSFPLDYEKPMLVD